MKKLIMALALVAVIGCCAACKSNSADKAAKGPEKVAAQAMSAIQKGDWDAYAKTFGLDESDTKMLTGLVEEKLSETINEKGGIKDYKFTGTELNEDGDKATVKVHINYKNGTEEDETMSFVKEEDIWKQHIDK